MLLGEIWEDGRYSCTPALLLWAIKGMDAMIDDDAFSFPLPMMIILDIIDVHAFPLPLSR